MTDATQLAPKRCFTHDLLGSGRVLVEDATTMAVDMAGFTSLTDRLSAMGTRGTEELSRVLRGYFGSVTDLVAEAGGDPVAFGGDSLSVLFDGPPGTTLDAALGVAARIQELTAGTTATPTPAGPVGVQVRVGIARGVVATAVARTERRLLPVHVGVGLDLAHAAQEAAGAGAVKVHDSAALRTDRAARAAEPALAARGPGGLDGLARTVDVGMLLSPVLLDRLRRGRALVESHRLVTVTFARFPAVEPGALRPFLEHVSCLMDLVNASGGEVVQVSGGDKGVLAMVVFGAPTAHADDPVRAVHGMLELRRREPRIAVGIATGPVFAAVLGSRTRMFPTHSGLAVNVAARLSQVAEPGMILVGAQTWEGSSRCLRQAGRPRRRAVKGCATPVAVHEVAGWRRWAPPLAPSAVPLLVGRVPELDRVEQLLDGVAAGGGGVLAIEGEPGIGKTRVVQDAVERARTRGFSVLCSDVADHPRGHPVGFWRDVVGGLLGVRRNAPRRAWLDALAATLPDIPGHLAILGPLLELGDAASAQRVAPDGGYLAPELAQAALGRLLRTGSRHRPVLLVVENIDRLDEASLSELRGVAAAAGGCAAGLLVTRGQEENPALEPFLAEVPTLALAPLDRDDTGLLAEEAWRSSGGGTPPSWLAGAVVLRAGGNPLFARVVARALLARWKPGDPPPAEEAVAGSVTSLLVGQVDRLPADARELLTVLAVAQRPCGPQLLRQVLTHDAPAIRVAAARLVSERLVAQADDGPEETYRLTHDLLRHVVYDAASHAERERLHRRLVDCLGAAGADPVEVAQHVHPLGDRELARRWFPPAARAARASWNLTGAIRWLQRLQPLLSGRARDLVELELLEVLLVAGRANEVLDRVDGAGADRWPVLVEDAVPRSADRLLLARRLHVLAEATYSCGQAGRTEVAASRVMQLVDGVDEPRYQRAGELLTLSRCHQGDLDGAVRAGRALVDRTARTADPAARANALAALAVALVQSGQPEAAAERYEAALVAAVKAEDMARQVHVLSDLAGCAYLTGRHAACVELLAQAREIADAIGYRRHLALNLNNEAQLRAALGDAYATSCAAVAVERSLELGDLPTAADALQTWLTAKPSLTADPALWRRLVDVDVQLDRSLEAAAEWADLAVVLARSGRPDAARDAARAAERSAPGSDSTPVRRRAAFARLLADAHDPARRASGVRAHVLAGLGRLAGEADLDEREAAEIALERWRLSRSDTDRAAAVSLAREAYAAEPSAVVRSWFRVLREAVPDLPDPLPPPVGIARSRTTRRDLEEALAGVEAAVLAASAPVATRHSA
jgi:class 3 adenylate cyclase/tetratricopeptide (TPR) repeat protein